MIFLNSYPLPPLLCYIYRSFSYSVEFHSSPSSRRRYLPYSLYNRIHSFLVPLFYVNLILSFLFPVPLFGEYLFLPFCFTALLRLVSAPSSRHYYFLASFFHFVFSHGLHCTFSTPSISSICRNSRAEMDFHSLRVILAYDELKWLKSSILYPKRFKHTYSE